MVLEDLNPSLTNGEAIAITELSRSPLGIVLMSLSMRYESVVLFPQMLKYAFHTLQQILQAHIVSIADQYTTPDKVQWKNAAATFRLPYWDWASTSVPPDEVINQPTVSVTVADGSTQDFQNPLYAYTFNPVSDGQFDSPWNQWGSTLRCPSDESPDAQTDVQQLIK